MGRRAMTVRGKVKVERMMKQKKKTFPHYKKLLSSSQASYRAEKSSKM